MNLRFVSSKARPPLLTQGRATYSKTHANDRTRADRLRHASGGSGIAALMPYLDDHWRETVVRRGIDELNDHQLPHPQPAQFPRRTGATLQAERAPTSATLGAQALEPFGTRLAICNCLYGVQAQFSEDLGAAFASAVNDWIAQEWLDRDVRLRASIVVPHAERGHGGGRDRALRAGPPLRPGAAAGRLREHAGPAAILADLRRRRTAGLPVGIHAGQMYRHPMTPVGWPSNFTEDYVNQATAFQSQLTSLIAEGVFAKFPALTVVLMESGVTWLPAYLWRLTKFWKGLRSEIPWVSDPPGSIVRDRVRLTLQPFDAPPDPRDGDAVDGAYRLGRDAAVLHRLPALAVRRADRPIPAGLDPGLAQKIMAENPLRTYARLNETGDHAHERGRPQPLRRAARRRIASWRSPIATFTRARRGRHRRGQQVALSVSVEALAGACRRRSASSYRQPWEKGSAYPKGQPQACRRDAWPPDGGSPGSDLAFMAEQHLDPNNVGAGHPESADAAGRARQNPRAVGRDHACHQRMAGGRVDVAGHAAAGSVVVPYEDAAASVKEIELRAGDRDFAQVLLLSRTAEPLGQRRYWPIYEAAAAAGLPVGIHAFGYGGWPNTAGGWGSYYIEEMVGHAQAQQALLISMILEGVFERLPTLRWC